MRKKVLLCLGAVTVLEFIMYGTSWGWLSIPIVILGTILGMVYITLAKKLLSKIK